MRTNGKFLYMGDIDKGDEAKPRMMVRRIVTIDGDKEWVLNTLRKSLNEGVNDTVFGKDRKITIETIETKEV